MARILLIEDDDDLRGVMNAALAMAGHTVDEARNGKEGIDRYQPESTDLVIVDLIMPEKEGLETILELKRKFPALKILATSGGGRMAPEAQLRVAKKLGASRTLAKPFSTAVLNSTVEELLASIQ